MIPKQELLELATASNLSPHVVEKDYVLGWLLAGIYQQADLREHWVFKGGTCLKKCYFETYRFSEDLDFTLRDRAHLQEDFLRTRFRDVTDFVYEQTGIELPIERITFEIFQNPRDKTACQGRIYYRGPLTPTSPRSWPRIKLDLIADEIVVDAPIENRVRHDYSDVPAEGIRAQCYSYVEVFAEKIRALGERTRPRDLYDVINFFRRPESVSLGAEVKRVLYEKCRYKDVAVPQLVTLASHREECASGWRDQLAHQLQSLPPFDAFWNELAAFFAWLNPPEGVVLAPAFGPILDEREPLASLPPIRGARPSPALMLLDRIRFAAANRLIVELDYRKENGERKTYRIEPYSLRRSHDGNILLYAVKLPAPIPSQAIRGFRADRMMDARITDQSFVPHYRIEFIPESLYNPLGQTRRSSGSRIATPNATAANRTKGAHVGPKYIYQCPYCSKKFTRTTMTATLNPHKQKNGTNCPGRTGVYITTKY